MYMVSRRCKGGYENGCLKGRKTSWEAQEDPSTCIGDTAKATRKIQGPAWSTQNTDVIQGGRQSIFTIEFLTCERWFISSFSACLVD